VSRERHKDSASGSAILKHRSNLPRGTWSRPKVSRGVDSGRTRAAPTVSLRRSSAAWPASEAAYLVKPPGRFVAEIVRNFERTSDFAARANAARSIRASDQPLLAGLRFILGHRAGWRTKAR
jgi:hypothetical protein